MDLQTKIMLSVVFDGLLEDEICDKYRISWQEAKKVYEESLRIPYRSSQATSFLRRLREGGFTSLSGLFEGRDTRDFENLSYTLKCNRKTLYRYYDLYITALRVKMKKGGLYE